MPFGAIWDYYCLRNGVPHGDQWLSEIKTYEGPSAESARIGLVGSRFSSDPPWTRCNAAEHR